MAAAYAYADGGRVSPEIRLLKAIDRFGAQAVMGRPVLFAGELNVMRTAEAIVNAYGLRERAEDWAAWAAENPEMAAFLHRAERLTHG